MPRPSNCGFHGVRFEAFRQKYKGSFWDPVEHKLIHVGYFDTAEEAARRYDEVAVEYYGSVGAVPHLNFAREAREKESKRKAERAKAELADGATRAAG